MLWYIPPSRIQRLTESYKARSGFSFWTFISPMAFISADKSFLFTSHFRFAFNKLLRSRPVIFLLVIFRLSVIIQGFIRVMIYRLTRIKPFLFVLFMTLASRLQTSPVMSTTSPVWHLSNIFTKRWGKHILVPFKIFVDPFF